MKKIVFGIMILVLIMASLLTACNTPASSTTPSSATSTSSVTNTQQTTSGSTSTPLTSNPSSSTTVAPPTQANWWDKFGKPQYGGTINVHLSMLRLNFDTADFFPGDFPMAYEALFAQEKWTLDRSIYPFNADFVPMKYFSGELATSWEMKDPTTMVVHLRQGVKWQNKAPVNGREFVASDVEAHYKRVTGPTASPHAQGLLNLLDTVTATDKYTLTVKFKKSGPAPVAQFMDQIPTSLIESPEYVALVPPATSTEAPGGGGPPGGGGGPPPFGPEGPPVAGAGGPLQDWHNITGTGAWMVSDVVAGSSETLVKNPDYWGYDERYPQNKLPYADSLKGIVIQDISTSLAALRTNKIDIIGSSMGGSSIVSWQQAGTLAKSNPELLSAKIPAGAGGVTMRVDKSPYTDIRVRQALNMAINRPLIAQGYFGGTEDGIPAGLVIPDYVGYAYPYSEWSQDLKDVYSYNVGKARNLMTDAGYPNGFKMDCIAPSNGDINLLQVIKSQLSDIGVDMTITAMDPVAWQALAYTRKTPETNYAGMTGTFKPANSILRFFSTDENLNTGAANDPTYDKLVNDFTAAADEDSAAKLFLALDKLSLEQAWVINVFPTHNFIIYQPYLKGYSGEALMWNNWYFQTARWWVDQSIKK